MNIVSLPMELDEKVVDSRYRLVIIAAQRAKEIAAGGRTLIESNYAKPTTVALEEALSGKLEILTGEEAVNARREARREEARRRTLEAEQREETATELSELEKDLKFYLDEKEQKEKKAIEDLFSGAESETDGNAPSEPGQ